MAPQPKRPGARNRRNLDQGTWTKLGADDVRPAPKFPGRKPPAAAKRYWDLIWASPASAMYLDTDQVPIERICRLHAIVVNGHQKVDKDGEKITEDATAAELAELRQLEQLYGLSPRARRSLQWEIDRAAGPGTAHAPQPHDGHTQEGADRRKRLSVVTT